MTKDNDMYRFGLLMRKWTTSTFVQSSKECGFELIKQLLFAPDLASSPSHYSHYKICRPRPGSLCNSMAH